MTKLKLRNLAKSLVRDHVMVRVESPYPTRPWSEFRSDWVSSLVLCDEDKSEVGRLADDMMVELPTVLQEHL